MSDQLNSKTARDKIISKIQKLLALADSSNENEAAAAAAKAQELLFQYNLELAEVMKSEGTHTATNDIIQEDASFLNAQRRERWEVDLAATIAFHCFTKCLVNKTRVFFIGRVVDTKIATFMFMQLQSRIELLAKQRWAEYAQEWKHANGGRSFYTSHKNIPAIMGKWKRSWIQGVIAGLQRQFDEQARQQTTALVLRCDTAIDRFIGENHNLGRKLPKASAKLDGAAYRKGVEDGKNMNVRRGLEATTDAPQKPKELQ